MSATPGLGGLDACLSRPVPLLDWCPGVAVCSHCQQVVPMGEDDGGGATESVLLAIACPRCGEAAMRLADAGVWD